MIGTLATWTPAASSAAILPSAVPLLPSTMAPHGPLRRPGGAVSPAMKRRHPLGHVIRNIAGSLLFGIAADLRFDRDHLRELFGSASNRRSTSMRVHAFNGIAGCPRIGIDRYPCCVRAKTTS